jgi:hypothetical protein
MAADRTAVSFEAVRLRRLGSTVSRTIERMPASRSSRCAADSDCVPGVVRAASSTLRSSMKSNLLVSHQTSQRSPSSVGPGPAARLSPRICAPDAPLRPAPAWAPGAPRRPSADDLPPPGPSVGPPGAGGTDGVWMSGGGTYCPPPDPPKMLGFSAPPGCREPPLPFGSSWACRGVAHSSTARRASLGQRVRVREVPSERIGVSFCRRLSLGS